MPVSKIKIRRSPGSKRIFSNAAACCHLLHGGSALKTSAATHATPTSCAAWDFSRETRVEGYGRTIFALQTPWLLPKIAAAATIKRESSTAKAWLFHQMNNSK